MGWIGFIWCWSHSWNVTGLFSWIHFNVGLLNMPQMSICLASSCWKQRGGTSVRLSLKILSLHQSLILNTSPCFTYRTAAQAGTVRPCRFPPASGGPLSGWQGGGHGGCGKRLEHSHPRRFRHPSGCGRHRWWRSCHSLYQWPSSCHLEVRNEKLVPAPRRKDRVTKRTWWAGLPPLDR